MLHRLRVVSSDAPSRGWPLRLSVGWAVLAWCMLRLGLMVQARRVWLDRWLGSPSPARGTRGSSAARGRALFRAARSRARVASRAFTLVELMVVVVMMGILAALALVSMRRYLTGSKASEGMALVESIRAAQERWRAEHLTYLDVSPTQALFPTNPVGQATRTAYGFWSSGTTHPDWLRWRALDPTVPAASDFCFIVQAGAPGAALPARVGAGLPAFPWTADGSTAPDYWYVVQGVADANCNGVAAGVAAASFRTEVAVDNDGE